MESARTERFHPYVAGIGVVLALAAALAAGEAAVLAVFGATLFVLAFPFTRFLIAPYLFLTMAFCVPMNEWPVWIGVTWYGADAMLIIFAGMCVAVAFRGQSVWAQLSRHERLLIGVLLGMSVFGLAGVLIGLRNGYALNEVLGDYRRRFFYPLILLAPLFMALPKNTPAQLRGVVCVGAGVVLLTGLYRAATGQSWNPESHAVLTEAVKQQRYFSYTEVTTVCAGLALAVASLRSRPGALRTPLAMGGAMLGVAMLLLSGWRLAIPFAVAIPVGVLVLIAWMRRDRLVVFGGLLALVIFVAAVGVVALTAALPEQADEAYRVMLTRIIEFDIGDDMRYYAWREAMEQLSASPVLGAGLGHQLVYFSRNVFGTFEARESSAHNTFVDVLYQTGPIGLALYAGLHLVFIAYVLRHLRAFSRDYHDIAIALFAGYGAILAFSLVEPLQVANIVTQYLLMGYLVYLARPRTAATP